MVTMKVQKTKDGKLQMKVKKTSDKGEYKNALEYINSDKFKDFHKGRKEQEKGRREGLID